MRDPHARRVAGLFGNIARFYDLLNHVLSLGLDRLWRRAMVRCLPPLRGPVLDLAAGTLDVSCEICRQHPQAQVVAVDFSHPMLARGHAKRTGRPIWPVQADARLLPLPDASVQAVTVAFGIRNIRPRCDAFAEILRVLRPGGKLVVLEFGTGRRRIWGGLYNWYLHRLLPAIGRMVSRDPEAYRYLAETIAAFPHEEALAQELEEAGFTLIRYTPMASGIVFLHEASRPE
ncbi:MAG: ubiquinone/menaquinone biosynthesis methyltransferase [Desulfomicrobiaceae bacterium]|jgi:demethylmenaquinone methyltransferase/2-methoxy-6-polyprenyl-1,4-benzoquinol methylase|nr:ubiquinone/menaquinone biosynthesis methyltransferase [Desulfomicrobiaceae bacterium]MBZ4684381.1 ubiquinone/menaquinone biosynthesis methyltransferase [Desulfomicrobiaceae bacterium]MDI3493791.1 demethylmenaquinone methyltransferase / 2-methoxy-6-polyprenyl,4-benzoquinol methylase [Desulfomicrobiaceae bacterium]MDK2873056.1 demethylmenaquinone methyltransferase / 2-methoxy-6-polyprenyl,4-benzoquinol methylase [Desulfomicrobiaceae bacterium]